MPALLHQWAEVVMTRQQQLSLVVFAVIAVAQCATELKWQNDVYTGRHFNALVTSSTADDGFVRTPAVLFMYAPECVKQATKAVENMKSIGPPEHFMVVLKHDYETTRKHIWYDMDIVDDLKERYMRHDDSCFKVLFFQVGYKIDEPFVWEAELKVNFVQWAWSFLRVNIDVHNKLGYDISVYEEGGGDRQFLNVVNGGQIKQVSTHFTRSITIYDSDDAAILAIPIVSTLSYDDWKISVTERTVKAFEPFVSAHNTQYLKEMEDTQSESQRYKLALQWKLAESALITYKQPIMLQRFTKQGYMKTKIPEAVYKELRSFYDQNQDKRISEGLWDNMEPSINTDSVQTTMVPLSDTERENVGGALHDVMENWCNCKLEQTAFYGIREYYHGNVLRMHVDNVESHIISSILLIYKDHDVDENWSLEVIDFDGIRREINLEEGEMLLYESGTLIHGRPLPYKGRVFANCFLHYKPVQNWNWRRFYERRNGPITVLSAQPGQELTLGASPTSFFFNATDMALPNDVSSFTGQPRLELVFPF